MVVIDQLDNLIVIIGSVVFICGDVNGLVFVDVVGGIELYIYNWSNGGIMVMVIDLLVGDYFVIVMDVNGCQIILSIVVQNIGGLQVMVNSLFVCLDEEVSFMVSVLGGIILFIFEWEILEIVVSIMVFIVIIVIYIVMVIDGNGCEVVVIGIVIIFEILVVDVGEDMVICLGES